VKKSIGRVIPSRQLTERNLHSFVFKRINADASRSLPLANKLQILLRRVADQGDSEGFSMAVRFFHTFQRMGTGFRRFSRGAGRSSSKSMRRLQIARSGWQNSNCFTFAFCHLRRGSGGAAESVILSLSGENCLDSERTTQARKSFFG
jgi:hypothetical protein